MRAEPRWMARRPGRGDETRSALQRAEACFSQLNAESIGTSAFSYNEAQLRFHEGNALTHLHDTGSAWQAPGIRQSI